MSNSPIPKRKRDGMNNIYDAGFSGWLTFVARAHLFNWPWRSSQERRIVRERVHMEVLTKSYNRYIPYIESLKLSGPAADTLDSEKVFSLWLQGEGEAPEIVRNCLESVRSRHGEKYVLLNAANFGEYINMPGYILEKWEKGFIIPAHFADLLRIELLYKYGGYWFDATLLQTGEVPELIRAADFFMYMANGRIYPHMFVQNCFIRARKGNPLLGLWRDVVYEYWKHNDHPPYYFLVQYLFKLLVTYNKEASRLFESMPKLTMDPTHRLWHELGDKPFDQRVCDEMLSEAFFQKCSYKSGRHGLNEIIPGSMADYLLNCKK